MGRDAALTRGSPCLGISVLRFAVSARTSHALLINPEHGVLPDNRERSATLLSKTFFWMPVIASEDGIASVIGAGC